MWLKRIANFHDPDSLASRMRHARFAFFRELLQELPVPVSLLDVGGTPTFWKDVDLVQTGKLCVTLLNLETYTPEAPNVVLVHGDARDMRIFDDQAFDVVFSNSVIEHVGTRLDQARMAAEVCRVGRRYFIQTPNRYFPIEPHFLLPMFQFYPRVLRIALVRRYQLGWIPRAASYTEAAQEVDQIQLLSAAELRRLFPDATLYRERFAGLTKSLVAYGGWRLSSDGHPRVT